MLVKFTIDGGCTPVTEQARGELLEDRLRMLREYDLDAEAKVREAIRKYLNEHTEFTAARIASTGNPKEWRSEFEALYDALAIQFTDPLVVHEEAGKFLGLLVWNEALADGEQWHFTQYPKSDSDYYVTHYFSVDGHIRASAKLQQAETARAHGDEIRASELEIRARALKTKWGGRS